METLNENAESMSGRTRWVLLRDLLIFQTKLVLDGFKDIALLQLSIVAAMMDLVLAGRTPPRLFYRVLRISERFDLWINLHGAAESAELTDDGLFGASEAGSDSLLGKLEAWVRRARAVVTSSYFRKLWIGVAT